MISIAQNIDCMIAMKEFPDKFFDLAVTDPEYGSNDAIGIQNGKTHAAKRTNYHLFKNIAPNQEYFTELKRVSKHQIIWGGNFFGLKGGVIVWNKNGTAFGEGEIAICSTHASVRFFEYTWNGMLQQNMKQKETRIHPTQKPVALYSWIFHHYAKAGDKILDTHGGSMSSVIAALKAGLSIHCYELDTDYYLQAKKRVENFLKQGDLFNSTPKIIFKDAIHKDTTAPAL